jgi:glycosyltransferase involved in cell wall biosynthesis
MHVAAARPLVVIPAFNEQGAVGAVVTAVRANLERAVILVVDDGSTDATATLAARAGALIAPHPTNLGVGVALRTGFEFAIRHGHDAVIQVDADGQHDPSQIGLLLEGLVDADIVVGSRFASKQRMQMSFVRRLAIRMLSRVVSIHCGTRITDATSGFRASGPRAIRLFAEHYPSDYLGDTVESLVLAGKVGLSVNEVGVTMNPRTHGRPSQSLLSGAGHLARSTFVILQSFIRAVPKGARELAGVDR